MTEHLFASFILDREQELEIAIAAESVTEATPITGNIQPLPASVPFLQGIMHLRDEVIPVLNLKKRLELKGSVYDKDAKIAVILLADQRFGLLFDDIRDVLRVDESKLLPVQPALQSGEYIISDLIILENEQRTLEVLDLKRLFPDNSLLADQAILSRPHDPPRKRTYSRYVIFSCDGREYGVPVENAQELTFCTNIEDLFKTDFLEGALKLRDHTIPVMSAASLLNGGTAPQDYGELSRILVMSHDAVIFGMIIDEMCEILTVVNEEILPMPTKKEQSVTGIYEPTPDRNIMLLDIGTLIASHMELLKSMARIKDDDEKPETVTTAKARHLITENCYLIFSIGKNFAIELKDVQEIIEDEIVMSIPGAKGFDSRVLNLRGQIIPVINLRQFYDYPDGAIEADGSKLIICKSNKQLVALQVDAIVTIYKQEQFHTTPSLRPQLQSKKDTLNRLIEFVGEQETNEHVLVINIHNLINKYLQPVQTATDLSLAPEES